MQIKRLHIALVSLFAVAILALATAFVVSSGPESAVAVESDDATFAAFDDEVLPGQTKKTDKKAEPEEAEPKEKPKAAEADEEPEGKTAEVKAEPKPEPPKPKVKKVDWKPAVLEVVTNFDKADVKVNGIPYPEYTPPGEATGVVLPAGGPYWVEVTADGNTKTYQVYLRPNETRLLLVDLTGFNGSRPAPAKPSVPEPKVQEKEEKKEEEQGPGKVTVYSKPPGTIMVDGEKTSDKTPGTLEVENGRHEIQVEYDGGGISEKKIVRVREGSRIKLFFRKRD